MTQTKCLVLSGLVHEFRDNRADDPLPLETRMQGAKILLQKTKHDNEAGWHAMKIQDKRERMYQTMRNENEDSPILGSLPKLSGILTKRV